VKKTHVTTAKTISSKKRVLNSDGFINKKFTKKKQINEI